MVALRVTVLALLLTAVSARKPAKVSNFEREDQDTLVRRANTMSHDSHALDDLLINMRKIEESAKNADQLEHRSPTKAPVATVDANMSLQQDEVQLTKADKDSEESFAKEMEALKKKEEEIEAKRSELRHGKSGLSTSTLSLEATEDDKKNAQDAVKNEMVSEVARLEQQYAEKGQHAMDEKSLKQEAEQLKRQIDAKKQAIYAAGKRQQVASEELASRMYQKNQELILRKQELTDEKAHLEKRRTTLAARVAEYKRPAQSLERDTQMHMSAKEMEMVAQDILDLQAGNTKLQKEVDDLETNLQKHYDTEKDRSHKSWVNRQELSKKQKEVERKEDQLKREIKQRAKDEQTAKMRQQRQAEKEAQTLSDRIQNLNMLVGKGWQESKAVAEQEYNQKAEELADLDQQEQLLKEGKVAQALGLAKKNLK
jgi:hypothetical protein